MPLLSTLISALYITIVLIPFLMQRAVGLQLVDRPNERKVHTSLVPRVGGIAMVLGMMIPFLVWYPKDRLFAGILSGIVLLAAFGIWDDRAELGYRTKLVGQILAALATVVIGNLYITCIPFSSHILDPGWVSGGLTVFCLLAITNAMNLSDGLDGLAGGASILSFGVVGLIAFHAGSFEVVILTIAVVGSILGFLRFNSHPARIFMGDTGSQFLGFVLGILVILITQRVTTAMSPVLPLLIFGVPVIDTGWVMLKRISDGRSPFSPDKNHIHHRLLACGFSHYETVVLLYIIQFGFVMLAYLFRFYMDWIVLTVFVAYGTILLAGIQVLQNRGFTSGSTSVVSMLDGFMVLPFKAIKNLQAIRFGIRILLPLLLLNGALSILLFPDGIPNDIGILASILVLFLLLNLMPGERKRWLDAISMYTASALLSYLGFRQGNGLESVYLLDWFLVAGLGIMLWLVVIRSQQRMFETSPLDILVILIAMLVPLLSVGPGGGAVLALAILKFIVLLYICEYTRVNSIVYEQILIRLTFTSSMLVVSISFWFQ